MMTFSSAAAVSFLDSSSAQRRVSSALSGRSDGLIVASRRFGGKIAGQPPSGSAERRSKMGAASESLLNLSIEPLDRLVVDGRIDLVELRDLEGLADLATVLGAAHAEDHLLHGQSLLGRNV